jgi:hypothetical protein
LEEALAVEAIYKLAPHRTMHLRAFSVGSAAAMTAAAANGFTVSGVLRAADHFAVVTLFDADDVFGHPRWAYLPDFDFTSVVLQFDVLYDAGLQPIDSPKFPSIDWPYLDVTKADGTSAQVNLFAHAVQQAGTYTKAAAVFTLNGTPATFDRVSLWYENLAFDYIVNPGDTAATVLAAIAGQINGAAYSGIGLTAVVAGVTLTVTADRAGIDGNYIQLYELHKNANLFFTPAGSTRLVGGSSAATWRVTLDFSALSIPSIRKMWLTFAARIANGVAYVASEFVATFTNWTVTDPGGKRPLKVAGPGSVRVGSRDRWAVYSGSWAEEAGFYAQGFAHHTSAVGDRVTVNYYSQAVHDLYLGTSLYSDRGILSVSLDGDGATDLDCYLAEEPAVVTRRKLRGGVAAGQHSVTLTLEAGKNALSTGFNVYFDYLEAAVAADVPDAVVVYSDRSVATDFDTDHTYRLPPARLVWQINRSGLVGEVDHYAGVFWWNQRVRVGGSFPVATVTFGGTWVDGDTAFVTIGGTAMGKSVFPADTVSTIAAHFASFINETFVGVWASSVAGVLTITCLSPQYSFTLTSSFTSTLGTLVQAGSLTGGVEGVWTIDPAVTPVLNRAVTDWHADYFAVLVAYGMTATVAFSMELVDPPDNPPGTVWAQRFLDGTAVVTDTGFAALKSTQCTFNATFRAFQQQAFKEMAGLMNAAGLTPWLQFGEFLWWFFDWHGSPHVAAGMAFYDADTAAAAVVALGRALASFNYTTDDPAVNGFADADFLRGLIQAHTDAIVTFVKATYAGAKFEILWPYDVNYPVLTAVAALGGRLNRYVNLPAGYLVKAGSNLDRWKTEALAFGDVERDLGKAQETVRFPYTAPLGWARADVRYLAPWNNSGCPWAAESLLASRELVGGVAFWAWDHLNLFSWPLPLPKELAGTATRVAA